MIHSMTGFAAQTHEFDNINLHMELRSVNSRYLDMFFRIGDELRTLEPIIRTALSARLKRGKLECRLSIQRAGESACDMTLNTSLLEKIAEAQSAVQARFPSAAALSVSAILRWPGILAEDGVDPERLQSAVTALTEAALDELIATRQREGEKLAGMIRERLVRMRELVKQVEPRMPQLVAEYREKMLARLQEVIATLDQDRVFQEVALFAQRIDVAEELSRLTTHLDEVERILGARDAAGKRLDFLMQELNREANTLASKSAATDVTAIAMELKVLIEQMREQVQNIE